MPARLSDPFCQTVLKLSSFVFLSWFISFNIASNHGWYVGGLVWISQWNSLQHPVASAFLAVVYSDYMLTSQTPTLSCSGKSYTPTDLRKFAMSQVYHLFVIFVILRATCLALLSHWDFWSRDFFRCFIAFGTLFQPMVQNVYSTSVRHYCYISR